ncbi:MAG TPA: alpha/beta hydrolase [Candidatus Blautia faecavium]|uniref:Alpha/beta hydrolase n=1 Tax=Candidatus Blautia faecavium TaxID=2838487 RepID=A0A9D2RYN4_9FIRM|nr:alpha/beta hydrolase [Candidatus Blautia faecavium]
MSKYYKVQKTTVKSAGKEIKLLILKPTKNRRPREETPGILWIHGGGYITGMAKMVYISRAMALVKKFGAVVVAPEYRLSKEAPYPAALLDCYAALKYIKNNGAELGINTSQIMVGGESAGGGLAAAVCMYARDKGEVNIAFQMPLYPMLDDRDTPSSQNNHAPVWNTKRNHIGWKAYLGEFWKKEVPAYAAPARQTDYSNLPPAYTFVGDIEPFYWETLMYIENLKKAGVEAKADVYPNCFHAFDMLLPTKKISRKAIAEFEKNYLYAAKHYFTKQKDT